MCCSHNIFFSRLNFCCISDGLSSLLIYTLQEMYKSFTVWRSPAKIERILCILVKYAYEIDSRIKFNGFLESTKHWIFQGKTFFNFFFY